ncbi:hypothetical protein CLV96_2593 [Leptospira meyeri]|uniref:Lipoprotein n=1 Tax=Leptospira meyeri TaxID=29508 RepID=A0A4R8MZ51_LEPME|nr:hypothetical protein [Leptospira meyeri]EKJ86483.1 putative lipoprotein [Leptospira meyeri serovar Hardjo str. Went 5]TDY73558.1 hypothetical protein CLV96_2593 [Leptospira meyeri]TGL53527.1 hypothetical protein EHQ55_02055 [Leptospira meyeri]
MKKIIIVILITVISTSCNIDIRQLPSPQKSNENPDIVNKKTINIRKFEIINDDLVEIESAWKYIFISFLKNDIPLQNKYIVNETSLQNKDDFILDIKIQPYLAEKRNYWWSLPIIYPVSFIWPIHFREIDYTVNVEYTIYQNENIIVHDKFMLNDKLKIYFYGLTRTSIFEEFIEIKNLKVLEKCISEISLHLYQF